MPSVQHDACGAKNSSEILAYALCTGASKKTSPPVAATLAVSYC